MVAEMGGLAEKQLADAIDALVKRDTELAQRVVAADAEIDALQREIEEQAMLTIARRQPMAVDLREIVAALRIASDLERIGDLAKNIAKRVDRAQRRVPPPKLIRGVEHMADLVLAQLKDVLDAYARRDVDKAHGGVARRRGDRRDVYVAVPRTPDLHDGRPAQHHALHASAVLAKNIERIGDHATNIAETVLLPRRRPARSTEQRPKGDTTSHRRRCMTAGDHDRPRATMNARILIVEDEEPLDAAAALQSRGRRLRGRDASARGDEAETRAAGERARSRRARLDAAGPVRASNCAGSLRARPETRAAADHHADRARRGERARARARHRRRRLRRQAVLGAGTAGARARAAAPRQAGAGRRACSSIGDIELDREKQRVSRARPRRSISARPNSGCSSS